MSSRKSVLIPLLVAVLLCLALLCLKPVPALSGASREGPTAGPASEPEPGREKGELRLLFAGDILLSRGVEMALRRASRSLVAALRPTISGADWAVGNLEGAVGSAEDCVAIPAMTSPRQSPCFSVRFEDVALLKEIGFTAMGMENNHGLDLGAAGREATRSALVTNGLTPLTFEGSPHFIRFGDVTLGLLTFSMVSNRGMVQKHRVSGKIAFLQPVLPGFEPCPNRASTDEDATDLDELRPKLRQARNLASFVIVYVHWGSEFLDWPDARQRRMAHWLVRNGADIIVGHHPHVVQKPEILNGKPVFYSLGNLLFDQRYPATKEGLLADCRISGDTARCSALTMRTPASSTYPSVTGVSGEAEDALAGSVLKAGPPLTVNGIILKPHKDSARGGPPGLVLEAASGSDAGKTLWKSHRAKIVSIEKMRVEGTERGQQGKEYLFTLEPHYSSLDGEEALRPCVYEARPEGLTPKWRGTSLAWPLEDATFLPGEDGVLCALHRGDSFIMPRPESLKRRVAAYRWNGFGFSGIHDPEVMRRCEDCFQ